MLTAIVTPDKRKKSTAKSLTFSHKIGGGFDLLLLL